MVIYMITGSVINAVLIIIGTAVGMIIKGFFSEKIKDALLNALGLVVLFIGIGGALSGGLIVNNGSIETTNTTIMIASMVIGTIIGEILNIEDALQKFGDFFERKMKRLANESSFSEGFVSATLIFGIGAMAVVGALENGLTGNYDILFAKSIIDGVMSIILASTLGIGVGFAAISMLIYQGSISLLASFIEPYLNDLVVSQMNFVGSILIFVIGLNMLNITKIKVGNMLPAIFIPVLWYIINVLI